MDPLHTAVIMRHVTLISSRRMGRTENRKDILCGFKNRRNFAKIQVKMWPSLMVN
jgi:hypothetical protein